MAEPHKYNSLTLIMENQSEPREVIGLKDIGDGHVQFDACVQTVDEINRNSNKYVKDAIVQAYKAPRVVELVARRAWFGEQAHPWDRESFNRCVDINPDYITHRICRIPVIEGIKCMSTIRTVEPKGKMLASWLTREKTQIGFSMRGLTPVSQVKTSPVKHTVMYSPITILTYDAVFFPSHKSAVMAGNEPNGDLGVAFESGKPAIITESALVIPIKELVNYITSESSAWKLFKDELGLEVDPTFKPFKAEDGEVVVKLRDGNAAKMRLESSIISEVGKYL